MQWLGHRILRTLATEGMTIHLRRDFERPECRADSAVVARWAGYHRAMIRALAALAVISAAGLALLTGPSAHAEDGVCAYRMSEPQLTTLAPAGTVKVTAILEPTHCDGSVEPSVSTVCITPDTGRSACAVGYGWARAQVFADPPQTTASYTSTGSGCMLSGNPVNSFCHALGPIRGTLGHST